VILLLNRSGVHRGRGHPVRADGPPACERVTSVARFRQTGIRFRTRSGIRCWRSPRQTNTRSSPDRRNRPGVRGGHRRQHNLVGRPSVTAPTSRRQEAGSDDETTCKRLQAPGPVLRSCRVNGAEHPRGRARPTLLSASEPAVMRPWVSTAGRGVGPIPHFPADQRRNHIR
jgi:hypothetical protein